MSADLLSAKERGKLLLWPATAAHVGPFDGFQSHVPREIVAETENDR